MFIQDTFQIHNLGIKTHEFLLFFLTDGIREFFELTVHTADFASRYDLYPMLTPK